MSYNPIIAAARRAAKHLARETGTPYHASLDTVAQQAGRADWTEYLSSPTPLPAGTGNGLYADGTEHRDNMRNMLITGVATLPAIMAVPFSITLQHPRSVWQIAEIAGFTSGLWMIAVMLSIMFFEMLAVHPDVAEIGRDGKRDRYTSANLARYAIGSSVMAMLGACLTRNLPHANLPITAIAAATAITISGTALAVSSRLTRRVLALIAVNGALVASLTVLATLPR